MPRLHIRHFILKAFERFQRAFVDYHIVAQQTHTSRAAGDALGNQTASHFANPRHFEHFFDFRVANKVFTNLGAQQSAGGGFHVIHQIIDHRIIANLDAFLIGRSARRGVGPHVKAHHWRPRGFGQTNITFRDRTHTGVQHPYPHLIITYFFHRLDNCLGRPLHIGLDQNRQLTEVFILLSLRHKLLECGSSSRSGTFVFCRIRAIFRNFAGLRLGVDDIQHISRFGCAIQAQNLDRNRWSSSFDSVSLIINQRTNSAPLFPNDKDIALSQCAFLHQNRGHRTASHIQLRLDYSALCCALGVGFQFKYLGL